MPTWSDLPCQVKSISQMPMHPAGMRGLKDSLSRQLHADGNPWDDGPLPDLTSGVMWSATGLLGAAVLLLPAPNGTHVEIALIMAAFAVGWGLFSLWMASRGRGMTVGWRALVTATTMPIVAVSLWATGGATSFLQPVMIFTALFISYFFPPRLAWPLNVLFVYAFATPLFYDDRVMEVGYPARLAMFALATAGATVAIHYLKGRLVRAELYQRTMAERDPLTSLSNRRAFDAALGRVRRAAAAARPPRRDRLPRDLRGRPGAGRRAHAGGAGGPCRCAAAGAEAGWEVAAAGVERARGGVARSSAWFLGGQAAPANDGH